MRINPLIFIIILHPLLGMSQDGVLAPPAAREKQVVPTEFPATALREVKLKAGVPVVIPVHSDRVTTILLPESPRAIHANNITTEATINSDSPAQFLMLYPEGADFFTVRALVLGAKTNINVIYDDGRISVLELVQSAQHHPVVRMIWPTPPHPAKGGGSLNLEARYHSRQELIGFIDTAKLYPVLKEQSSPAVSGVSVSHPKTRVEYEEGFSVAIIDLWKFDPEKVIVAKLVVSNNADNPLSFDPESLTLYVGNRDLPASITNGDGIIGPRTSQQFYAVFDKFSNGDPAAITLKNSMHAGLTPLRPIFIKESLKKPLLLPSKSAVDQDGGKAVLFPPAKKKSRFFGIMFGKKP